MTEHKINQIEKIQKFSDISSFAKYIGYNKRSLLSIAYGQDEKTKYSSFEIPKKTGGTRKILVPNPKLKQVQRRIADILQRCYNDSEQSYYKDNKIKPKYSLSHGFKQNHSIVTNARRHRKKRFVLNLDLKDFFPSIHFGRINGFLIKNKRYRFNKNIARIIATIACHERVLPQGSPLSPVISNIIASNLDRRLHALAKKNGCSYSRYADDITFSTNKVNFPNEIAYYNDYDKKWNLGYSLIDRIHNCGFEINHKKTIMQKKGGKQIATGLVVNEKINIDQRYYKYIRAMCHSLFQKDKIHKPTYLLLMSYENKEDKSKELQNNESMGYDNENMVTQNQLAGMINFVYNVKFGKHVINADELKKGFGKLYKQFFYYHKVYSITKPLIICEGATDNIYLKCALKKYKNDYPKLIQNIEDGQKSEYQIQFLNQDSLYAKVLKLGNGVRNINIFNGYHKDSKIWYQTSGYQKPIIFIVDNDREANDAVRNLIEKNQTDKDNCKYYKISDNFYLVFISQNKVCYIEKLFDDETLKKEINGKTLSLKPSFDKEKHYSKTIFANKVNENWKNINFDNFKPILNCINEIIAK